MTGMTSITTKTSIKIRKAEGGDLKRILCIFKDSAILNPKDKNNKELKDYIYFFIKNKRFLVLVAEYESNLAGVCVCKLEEIRKGEAVLLDIYALKKYRSRGIGKRLMNELCRYLRKEKVKRLGLYSENNDKTLNFYKKQGFKIGRLIRRCDKNLK